MTETLPSVVVFPWGMEANLFGLVDAAGQKRKDKEGGFLVCGGGD